MKRADWAVLAMSVLLCFGLGMNSLGARKAGKKMEIKVTSTAFKDGEMLPDKCSFKGGDESPPLAWNNAPDATKSFALICDDPDAPRGDWVHWVIYFIPPGVKSLAGHQPKTAALPNGAKQGTNDFPKLGYDGPAPPSGTHRYFFRVYALNTELNLRPNVTKAQLLKAMEGHILAQGQIMGKFSKH